MGQQCARLRPALLAPTAIAGDETWEHLLRADGRWVGRQTRPVVRVGYKVPELAQRPSGWTGALVLWNFLHEQDLVACWIDRFRSLDQAVVVDFPHRDIDGCAR
jgi:hypothetical protein